MLGDSTEEGNWAFSELNSDTNNKRNRVSVLALIVKYTKPFWIALVAADLLCMAVKNVGMTDEELARLDLAETAFSLAFLFEIMLRMLNQRKDLRGFFQDKLNLADFFLAVVTCIIQIPPIHENQFVYVWFTGFQVLRIYRLVVAVPRLRKLMVLFFSIHQTITSNLW